ncbi:hypothetical protein [Arthrobacter sp. AL12]|uniref:hypothetical protein n=1 Tax=Arthrobacter sp. AL12 TaxID=3042241 RepID=UPI002499E5AB|nr:hypothetical protein [Arthrobacter sp. AL12]MDI3212811.1 hypothetical protein [Arthrobacter sp. AL12]
MPTLQRRQLVGHDILLARHGNHITTMRVDRRGDRVIAFLDDGSTDSAPNRISPGRRMPGTSRLVVRGDWKLCAAVTACTAGFAGVTFTAALAVAAAIRGDPAMAELLSSYSGT